MTRISIGSRVPNVPVYHLPPKVGEVCVNAPEKIDISSLKVPTLIVIVPGAFTPTCSERHIPGFLTTTALEFIKDAGIKKIFILSVDSPFITRAWGDSLVADKPEINEEVTNGFVNFVSDAGAEWLQAAGLVGDPVDTFAKNGLRGLRSAIIVNELGHVQYVGVDTKRGVVEESGIQGVLCAFKTI